MDGEPEALAMGAEEIEAAPRIDDEDPGAMHREGMEQHGVHGRGLARARGAQDQHVGVLLAVLALQGIEGQELACAVEEGHARAPGPGGASVERQEARDVAREGQPAAPPDAVEVGLVVHGQVLDVGVEGNEIVGARDRLDAVGYEERVEPVHPLPQAREVRGPEVEGLHQRVDLVALGDRALCHLAGLAREQRLRALTDGRAHDPRDVVQDLVLRPEDNDLREHRALRHLIEEREGLIAQGSLGGVVAGLRGPPQALDGDAPLRHAIEPPYSALPIRARRAQEERIGEVPAEGQILVAGIGHALEEPVRVSVPERRSRVEPGHEPLVEHAPIPAARCDTGGGQGRGDPHADIVQLGEGQRGLPRVPHPPVDHRPHPPPAPPPAPARHPVLEEPRGRADAREVGFKGLKVMGREGGSEERQIGLVADPAENRLQARILLHEKLEHPGVGVFLRHRIGDEVLQPRAEAPEILRTLTVGRGGPDLEEGAHAPAIGQREGLVLGQVLRPGQEVREGPGCVVELPDPGPGDGTTVSGLAGKEM